MARNKNVLILGIGGQNGYFASWLLVNNGFNVTGVLLATDLSNETISFLPKHDLSLLPLTITDYESLRVLVRKEKPEFLFNFAGISFIPLSWEKPSEVERINGYSVGQLLQIIRGESPTTRFFQACSSEMFGHRPVESPQNENTPFNPDNPYGSSKVFAYHLTKNYRERYGMFACSGILYNHESEWRPETFVTRKIISGAVRIKLGLQDVLNLGELDTVRDWSYAGDIVEAIWQMMNADEPKDYILSSGQLHRVRDVLDTAFGHLGLDWSQRVIVNSSLKRQSEGMALCGNSTRARSELGWCPRMNFENMIKFMVNKDLERLGSQKE